MIEEKRRECENDRTKNEKEKMRVRMIEQEKRERR